MTRRNFLATAFLAGVMLAVGVRTKAIEPKERPAIAMPVWIKDGQFSYDEGKTWTGDEPPSGTPVACLVSSCGHYQLRQDNRHFMPTYLKKGDSAHMRLRERAAVNFTACQSLSMDAFPKGDPAVFSIDGCLESPHTVIRQPIPIRFKE